MAFTRRTSFCLHSLPRGALVGEKVKPPLFSPPVRPRTSYTRLAAMEEVGGQVVFEPIVNLPALISFLFIAIVFSLLIARVRAVEEAVERRKAALQELRRAKSVELSFGANTDEVVARALQEYEEALKLEEDLRTLSPGVRVVAPNQSLGRSKENIAAARQFLGIDLEEPSSEGDEEQKGLSSGSVAILVIVALSQLALLLMLSFDPMESFITLGGSPPDDLPPKSW